jgi:hypothetical protein
MVNDLQLALLCVNAYTDGNNHGNGVVRSQGASVVYDKVVYYKQVREVEVVGYYLNNNDFVLAVRGTETHHNSRRWYTNWFDIVRNLRAVPWKTEFGWGHAGFYKGAKYWLEEYKSKIPKNVNLHIVGHSMGAQIAAWMALHLRDDVSRVVLFAEPKGFFRGTYKTYSILGLKSITTSYLNGDDWIRNVPPWGKRSVRPTMLPTGTHKMSEYIASLLK